MNRRAFLSTSLLTSVVVGAAAVLHFSGDDLPDSNYEVASESYRDESGATGTSRPVSFSADVLGGRYDEDSAPVTVEITMENTSDGTWYYRSNDETTFVAPVATDERHRLIDAGRGDELGREFTGNCWTTNRRTGITGDVPPVSHLPERAQASQEKELVVRPTHECPDSKPEEVEFSTRYVLYEDEETNSEMARGEWGFALSQV